MSYKILTIEDDLLIAADLQSKLTQLGYTVLGNARDGKSAIELAAELHPELIIADVMIEGEMDGIDAVSQIYEFLLCPVIYLTANSESSMVKRALATQPAAFLIKPFKISEFAINIDLAVKNFQSKYAHVGTLGKVKDSIFVPDKFLYHRVYKDDIFCVEADGSYVKVITSKKNYHLTTNLKTFIVQFEHPDFYRVSRKHLINITKVDRINGNMLYLKSDQIKEIGIPISKPQRAEIFSKFEIIRTKG